MAQQAHKLSLYKPSRSEEIISEAEKEAALKKAKEYFASIAPQRTHKPPRSEIENSSDPSDVAALVAVPTDIPELKVLMALKASGEIIFQGSGRVTNENDALDTDYYKSIDLDADHIATGKGFIPLDVVQELPLGEVQETTTRRRSFSNPATNDWVPAPATNPFDTTSTKPRRSN